MPTSHMPFPMVFAGLGSRPMAAEGTTLSPECCDGEFSKNPAFLAVSPQLCRWMELNWINFRGQETPCTPQHRTSLVGKYMLSERERGFGAATSPSIPVFPLSLWYHSGQGSPLSLGDPKPMFSQLQKLLKLVAAPSAPNLLILLKPSCF